MTDLLEYQGCPGCGSPNFSVLASTEELDAESRYRDALFRRLLPADAPQHDWTIFTNAYPARLVVCGLCGLVSRDPRFAPAAALDAYAREDYGRAWMDTAFREYLAAFRALMPSLIASIGRAARVLEVGSYVGGFLAAAREQGWQAQGIDVGRCVSEYAREHGADVFTGTLSEAGLPDGAFDAVFVWVCFDQLPDARAELREIRRILKQGGWLFTQVPNGDFVKWAQPLARVSPAREHARKLLAYTGLAGFPFQTGYTPAALDRMLRTSGFADITLRNRANLSGTPLEEQRTYVERVHRLCELLYHLSLRQWVKGPWLRVVCRKV